MMNEKKAEEIEEIIGNPPAWLLSYGTVIIILVTMVFVVLGWVMEFPEKIHSEIEIVTLEPPAQIYINKSNYLAKLSVNHQDTVNKGDILAIMESEAKLDDIMKLEYQCKQLLGFEKKDLKSFELKGNLQLGSKISTAYFDLQESIRTIDLSNKNKQIDIRSLRRVKRQKYPLEATLKILQEKDLSFAEKNIKIAKAKIRKEQDENSIKRVEAEADLLKAEEEMSSLQKKIEDVKKEIADLNLKIFTLEYGEDSDNRLAYQKLNRSLYKVLDEINAWKNEHLFYAPIDGTVSLNNTKTLFSKRPFLRKDALLMSVLNHRKSSKPLVGKITLDAKTYSKVSQGQTVLLQLDGYPTSNHEKLKTIVHKKSTLARDNSYEVEILIKEEDLNKRGISFVYAMKGKVEILTKEYNIWRRITSKI
jgi:anti-sigma28 factor (negative regulator of flagellin synthesis)